MKSSKKVRMDMGLKMGTTAWVLFAAGILALLLLASGCTDQKVLPGPAASAGLTILVDDPEQSGNVRDIVAMYRNQTGKAVVVQEITPAMAADPGLMAGDLLVSDMSRIPVYADAGILTGLNDLLDSGATLNWTLFERPPLEMVGGIPDQPGTIYALPFSSDALGVVYRTDLFNDPEADASFCSTRGYPIGIPGTYDELNTLASFFSHQTSGMSGIGFAGSGGQDPRSSPWLSIVSSYGSGVLNRSQGNASGTWNSSSTGSALMMLRTLSRSEPDGAGKWGDREVISEFGSGNLAMAITWFSRFPELFSVAEEHNLSAGFFPLPGQIVNGNSYRGITVKMDGISIITTGSPDRSLDFLTWFYSPRVQLEWAASGHQPSLIPVLDSNEYLSMNTYNRGFPESMRTGVTEAKGHNSEKIRQICEKTVGDFLSMPENTTAGAYLSLLDGSAGQIDTLPVR